MNCYEVNRGHYQSEGFVCVCNQGAHEDNLADAVDLLLFITLFEFWFFHIAYLNSVRWIKLPILDAKVRSPGRVNISVNEIGQWKA